MVGLDFYFLDIYIGRKYMHYCYNLKNDVFLSHKMLSAFFIKPLRNIRNPNLFLRYAKAMITICKK